MVILRKLDRNNQNDTCIHQQSYSGSSKSSFVYDWSIDLKITLLESETNAISYYIFENEIFQLKFEIGEEIEIFKIINMELEDKNQELNY